MGDYDRFASLFTHDAVWRIPDVNVEFVGREEIRAGFQRLGDDWEYFVQNTHPGVIQLEGDTASGRDYIYQIGRQRDGRSVVNYALFHDRYQRTPDGWKFTGGSLATGRPLPIVDTDRRKGARTMTHRQDQWDGWKLGWQHAFFGLLLTVALTQPDALSASDPVGGRLLRIGLVVALAGWYAYWFGPWPVHRPRAATAGYLLGAIGLWLVLVVLDPAFWLSGFAALIPLVMRHARVAAIAVATCGGLWLANRAAGGALTWPEVVATALTIGAGIMFLGYLAAVDREAGRRAQLLDELAAAQAELAATAQHAGTLAERQRLAREVHDTLTQGFASIVMLLEAVQEHRNGATTAADGHIATALRTARDNLTESQRVVWALQPSPLDEASLADAVRLLTQRLAEETGTAATAVVTGDPTPLAAPVEAGVLRVVQEALTNARRHARAREITVTLSYLPDALLVDVHDNGVGMPADPPLARMGQRAMRQRAAQLGGTLTIESEQGQVTTVALSVPIPTTAAQEAGT